MGKRLLPVAAAAILALLLVVAVRESSDSAVSGSPAEPPPPEVPELVSRVSDPGPSRGEGVIAGDRGRVDTSGRLPAADLVQATKSSSADRIRSILGGKRRYDGEEVAALIALAERSLVAKDLPRLRAAIQGMTASGAGMAQEWIRKLLEEAEPEIVALVEDVFGLVFRRERIPLIGEIARERSWLGLLARHGDEDDIGWLVARAEERGVIRAETALRKSEHPAARTWLESRMDRERVSRAARKRGERREIEEGIRRWSAEDGGAESWPELVELFGRYGTHLIEVEVIPGRGTVASFAVEPKAFLVGLDDIWKRVAAVSAIQPFGSPEAPGFERILEAPAEVFESDAASADLRRLALQTVERCRVCWSERTARALERAAEAEEVPLLAKGEREAAARVRASLENR